MNEAEELWWSKGGELVGASPEPIAFLLRLIQEAPGQALDPLPSEWDARWAGSAGYRLAYFGFEQPRYRWINLASGSRWRVDIIDTWQVTIGAMSELVAGRVRIPLPGRQ